MAGSHTLTMTWASGGGTLSAANTLSGTGENNIYDESIPTGGGGTAIVWACPIAQIKLLWMHSTQDVTYTTNGGAGDVIALKAGIPFIMFTNYYDYAETDLLNADVVTGIVTNASGSTATFNIRCLIDSTP